MVSSSSRGPTASSSVQTETLCASSLNGLAHGTSVKIKPGSGVVNGSNVSHSLPHNVPLSSRRSQPLDMSSVERKGQKRSSFWSNQKSSTSLHGLMEAPIFRPTEDEFRDPMEYIKSIAPQGRKYGIIKVIPPTNWNPDFAIDTEVRIFQHIAQRLVLLRCEDLILPFVACMLTFSSDSISKHENRS